MMVKCPNCNAVVTINNDGKGICSWCKTVVNTNTNSQKNTPILPIDTPQVTPINEEVISKALKASIIIYALDLGFQGSGFIVSNKYIITNAHVVTDVKNNTVAYSKKIIVRFDNSISNISYSAQVIGFDVIKDVAVLEFHAPELVDFCNELKIITTNNVNRGQKVFTIGNPESTQFSYASGDISNPNVIMDQDLGISMIQLCLPTGHGGSGGPLCNSDGDVIGIIAAMPKKLSTYSYAVKSEDIIQTIKRCKK